ncbi:MAG: TIGR01777 family oxidoreductase [Halieaceae bacterium]
MKILLTGGTGFIGGALIQQLQAQGAHLVILTRDESHYDSENIKYINSLNDISDDEYFECFINLAGESIAQQRWSETRKTGLVESRVGTTRSLYALAARLTAPPAILLSASAIGYYGSQGDDRLAEGAASEESFSHRLCLAWEDEARRFADLGTRVCILRLGVVLAAAGGAMDQLKKSVQFGVATWMGSGRQWLSWVHRDDVLKAISFLLEHTELEGVFNITAPEPVTNRGFCEELRHHRKALLALPIPGFVMRLALGEMADELLLQGQRVIPRRLQEANFEFRYSTLAEALPSLLQS